MIGIAMRPVDKAGVVKGEGLYVAEFKLGPLAYKPLLHIRAKNAKHAEEKLFYVFEHELTGKTLDFCLDDFKEVRINEVPGVPEEGRVPEVLPEGK